MPNDMRNRRNGLQEVHIAVLGQNGSGKSGMPDFVVCMDWLKNGVLVLDDLPLTVKYITKRYITEYDPNLEDTYCKHENIHGHEYMVWIMDTVEGHVKDPNRYMSWADIFLVLYSVTNLQSFEYAQHILKQIKKHEHKLCLRQHTICLIGNKTDMERYRQVSKADGSSLAETYGAEFFEVNTTEEFSIVKSLFHSAITTSITQKMRQLERRSPSPRNCSSDSEMQTMGSMGQRSKSTVVSPMISSLVLRRAKSPADKLHSIKNSIYNSHQPVQQKKSSPGLKLLKLFQTQT